jgi:hypothetical protein
MQMGGYGKTVTYYTKDCGHRLHEVVYRRLRVVWNVVYMTMSLSRSRHACFPGSRLGPHASRAASFPRVRAARLSSFHRTVLFNLSQTLVYN